MVKIRLTRLGNKHRPFYRVVVAKSTAGRDSASVEVLGTYNPIARNRDERIKIKTDRALHWLMEGAQPTDTVAHMLKTVGVLEEFFKARPAAAKRFKGLDKRVAALSTESVASAVPAAAAVATPVVEAPAPAVEEAAPVAEAAPAEEAPAAEPEA